MTKRKSTKTRISFKRRLISYYNRFTFTLKISLIIVIGLAVFTDILRAPKKVVTDYLINKTALLGLTINQIVVEGKRNISTEEIAKIVRATENMPIFALDLESIRVRLEENSWIKTALVERRLPNTIYIAIVERIPIALWQFQNKLYLIDEDGTRISSQNIEKFADLLHVVGSDANVYARNLIADLQRHPNLARRVVSAVRYGERRWDLNLEQNINVKMPEKNFQDAYDYLDQLNKANKLFDQGYKTINLKDPDKYYIEKYEDPR